MTCWVLIPPHLSKNCSAKSLLCAQKKIRTKRYSKRDRDASVPVLILLCTHVSRLHVTRVFSFLVNANYLNQLNVLPLSVQKIANVRAQLTQAVNKIGPLQRHNARITRENTKLHRETITMREQTAADTRWMECVFVPFVLFYCVFYASYPVIYILV